MPKCDCGDCRDSEDGCSRKPESERCEASNDEHTCPYQLEINEDETFTCRCCECKTQQCRWNI